MSPQVDVQEFIRRGNVLLDVSRPGEAIAEFERALAMAPDDADVLCYIALAFTMLKDPDRALEYVSRAIAANPELEWAFRLKALGHLQKDQRSSAYKAATRAVQLDPENVDCLTMLGRCALSIERDEEAKVLAGLIVQQAPESTNGHQLLGDVAESRSKLPEAAKHFEKVLELDPSNVDALESLARIRNQHNRFGESVSLLRGALHVDPTKEHRQNSFRDSLKYFSLFGEPHQRRKSVAGLMVALFLLYLFLGVAFVRAIEPGSWFASAFQSGLAILVLAGIPFLRTRFFRSQSAQLQMLYQHTSHGQRKRTLLAALVALVTAYGIAGLVYRDVGDAGVFWVPLSLAITALWIYMLAITLRLFVFWFSDTWSRVSGSQLTKDERGLPIVMYALPIATVAALGFGLQGDNGIAWFLFLLGAVSTAMVYFRRYPVATGAAVVVAGLVIMAMDWGLSGDSSELTPVEAGAFVGSFGVAALAYVGFQEFRRHLQRRRLRRLLGSQLSGADGGGQ